MSLGKERKWQRTRTEVDLLADRLGRGIDEHIKEAVTALRVYGFPTSQSCEGHLEEQGELFPWIIIHAPAPKKWQRSRLVQAKWRGKNLRYQQHLLSLLADFYARRRAPFDAQLIFQVLGIFGGFKLLNRGAAIMCLLSQTKRREKLALYRYEMDAFARFLRKKHFAK